MKKPKDKNMNERIDLNIDQYIESEMGTDKYDEFTSGDKDGLDIDDVRMMILEKD